MDCKYLKKLVGPSTRMKSVTLKDDAGTPDVWLCRYEAETGSGEGLVMHCPLKFGEREKCLFANEGGPFPPDTKERSACPSMKPQLKVVK